jgi:hypothetical protein
LRVGEAIPYRRADAGNWQAVYAYPVDAPGGARRAVVEKVFGGNDTSGSFGDLGLRSGYDLLEIGRDFVSGIRTSDPGGGDQIFWRTAACERADGWIFFPVGLRPGERGETRSTLKITKGPSIACPRAQLRNIAPDDTVWERPLASVHYTSGKLLDSIVSEHFAYGDPADTAHDDDSMEKFYFTREYGFSRWEAWETPAGCQKRAARGGTDPAVTCRPSAVQSCNGDNTATYFGKLYLRLDCRDSTFIAVDADRPFNPLVNDAAPGDVTSRNLLANGSFVEGADHWDAPGATPVREPRGNNAVLAIPPEGRLAQDFVVPSDVVGGTPTVLRWGLSLAPTAAGGQARLALTIAPDGRAPQRIEQVVRLDETALKMVHFDVSMPAAGDGSIRGRFEVVLEGRAGARIDDAFVAALSAPRP